MQCLDRRQNRTTSPLRTVLPHLLVPEGLPSVAGEGRGGVTLLTSRHPASRLPRHDPCPKPPVARSGRFPDQQYLDAEGNEVRKDLPAFAKDLDHMVELYKLMLSTRVFDAKSIALQRTGKLGTYASCLGNEAAHVGIGSAMK